MVAKISDIVPGYREQLKLSYHKHKDSLASDSLPIVLEVDSSTLVSPSSINHSKDTVHKLQRSDSGCGQVPDPPVRLSQWVNLSKRSSTFLQGFHADFALQQRQR
jgi:hypothetical protein